MKFERRRAPPIKSLVVKQSASINGRHSSVSLEGAFWNTLKEIATTQHLGVSQLISKIDSQRQNNNLSSTLRVYVLTYYGGRDGAKT
jgi:predicted DNA-binding ribbon-helix-helix protein